jgi:hypothetical protein
MASNFSSLRKSNAQALDALNKKLKEESSKQGADERFWKLTVDPKTKIGYARLRFLPASANEDLPWVRLFKHAFQRDKGVGKWLIENCPTTLGNERPCPVCKQNNVLWNSGIESEKNIARDRKRQQKFVSNVLVIEDSAHPENNGKVFLFSYGPKIHEKVQESISPKFPDQKPLNPFDMWAGADFKLRSQNQAGYQNYDKSEFTDAVELFPGDDAKKEAVWNQQYPLQPFVADDQFKAYDDLAKRLDAVLNGTDDAPKTAQDAMKQNDATAADAREVAQAVDVRATRRPRASAPAPKVEPVAAATTPEDEDDIKNFFAGVIDG